jgi:RNA polymerase sigma-70 factor (ECF subfamily)
VSETDVFSSEPVDVDRDLVRSIAGGSADALAEFYDRHAPLVFGLARRMAGRPEDAEEIVQDVFAQVWRQAERYQGGRATVAGWLVMLTRTRAIDRIRARSARPDLVGVSTEAVAPLVSPLPDPESIALSAADVDSVRRALLELPDAQRFVVEMAYFEGLSHSEIADLTGIALGTVKTRLRAAMFSLRDALGSARRPS